MIATFFKRSVLDKLGLLLSLGCALHCLVMALLPFLLPSLLESGCCHDCEGLTFHSVSAFVVLIIALLAFARPCCWRDKSKIAKLVFGFMLLFAPNLCSSLQSYETVMTVLGTALIASAHWQNIKCYVKK